MADLHSGSIGTRDDSTTEEGIELDDQQHLKEPNRQTPPSNGLAQHETTYPAPQTTSVRLATSPRAADAPPYYVAPAPAGQPPLDPAAIARVFNPRKQTTAILIKHGLFWLCTALAIVGIVLTLRLSEYKGVITSGSKRVLQAITTTLILVLGLFVANGFKGMATVWRWWILARKPHSLRKTNLIMGLENLSDVFLLALERPFKIGTFLCCMFWLFLFFLTQGLVATISVTYSVNDGLDWKGTYITHDTVMVSNLSCYFHSDPGHPVPSCDSLEGTKQGIAHAFGELAQESPCGAYTEISDVLSTNEDLRYFCRRDANRQEFTYRFSEYHPDDTQRAYPYFTNRTVTASSGPCYMYKQSGPRQAGKDTNGVDGATNIFFTNGTHSDNITVPNQSAGLAATTYIYRGTDPPHNETAWSCGPRCIWMWAFKESSPYDPDGAQFFQCPITVDEVTNTSDDPADPRKVPDDMARLAAAAIALEGRSAWATGPNLWTQFRYYPYGSVWEVHYRRPDDVGANMAEFALGSLATMVARNPRLTIPGTRPNLGSTISVDWRFAIGLFIAVAGIHLLLLSGMAWATARVVVTDGSALSVAKLLEPLVHSMGPSGSLLSGEEISKALHNDWPNGVVYGPHQDPGTQNYVLRIDLPAGRQILKPHPSGLYS